MFHRMPRLRCFLSPLVFSSLHVRKFFEGKVTECDESGGEAMTSCLYYHPTLWAYLAGRLGGVK